MLQQEQPTRPVLSVRQLAGQLKPTLMERAVPTFCAVLAANLVAGVLLLVAVRYYVHWSIRDAMDGMGDTMKDWRKDADSDRKR